MISFLKKNKIAITGGTGRFGKILVKKNYKNFVYPSKKQLDITKITSVESYIKKNKPGKIIHLAGLSRPLDVHDKNPTKSILLNIIGTSNLAIACEKFKVKLIYFSTNYVYPGIKGGYKETDNLLPSNNYAWSKLGGEAAVQMIKNSLILRVCMTERPFVHKYALADVYLNFTFQENIAEILPKLLNFNGVINVGGPTRTVFQFAKKNNPKVKKISAKKVKKIQYKKNMSMNIGKLKNLIKSNKNLLKNL
jgi:dTDP-4-dehydrorhamnose reductase